MPAWKKVIVSGSDASLNSINVTQNVTAQSFTGSLLGTASYSTQALSSSYALTASYALNAGGGGSTFPFTGSARITGSLILTGSLSVTQSYISTVDYIDFTLTVEPAHNEGRIHWIDDTKTLNVDTDVNNFYIELGHQNVVRVNNQNSFTLAKGTVVYINGESGQRPTVATASFENDALSAATLGLVVQNINSGQNGYVVTAGIIRGINTNAYAPGTMLYLSSSGQFSSTVPQSPLHEVRLGKTITQATAGTIFVDVMNGYELGELHDVLINGRQNGDLITWDSGSRVWKNSKTLSGSYGVSGSLIVSEGITGSLFGTSSYAIYGEGLLRLSGSTIYPFEFGTENFSTDNSVLIGSGSGKDSPGANNSIFIGTQAGQSAANSEESVFIGLNAGNSADSSNNATFIGRTSGLSADNSSNSTFIGADSGRAASGSFSSTFLGVGSGYGSVDSNNSIMIGRDAGSMQDYGGSAKQFSILIGDEVAVGSGMTEAIAIGRNASSWQGYDSEISIELGLDNLIPEASRSFVDHTGFNSSVILGNYAGYGSGFNGSYYDAGLDKTVEFSNSSQVFIGQSAGAAAYNSPNSTFIGAGAGISAANLTSGINSGLGIGSFGSTFIGWGAGIQAYSSSNSTFIGAGAGGGTYESHNSTFVGAGAGTNAAPYQYTRPDSILIGAVAGGNAGANYTIAIGQYAGFVKDTDYENLLSELIPIEYQANFTNAAYTQSILIGTRAGYNAGLLGQYTLDDETFYYGLSEGTWGGQIFIGNKTGERAYNTMNSVFIGEFAGSGSHTSGFSTFIGPYTGIKADNSNEAVFIGAYAGHRASNSLASVFIGPWAGYTSYSSSNSVMIGPEAGDASYNVDNSVFLGFAAGNARKDVGQSVFLGYAAGCFDSETATLPGIDNAVFIGPLAGFGTHTSDGAVFIGNEAGQGANHSSYSTFLGNNAGYNAYSSSKGIFIGSQAGSSANNSPFSIYLGNWNSMGGYGTNNIAIGNGIGLPYTSSNQMNIAGLIFGSGSFSEYGEGVPFTGSANGRIGINQPNPRYSFDVSGSGNYTNGLTVTGSLAISSSLFQYADNTDVDIGTEVVLSIQTGSYRSAFFDYVISSGSNARAGTVMSVWGSASIDFTETSTNDIGTTTDVTLSTILSGSFVQLRATTLSNNWTVKSLVRML